MAIISSTKKWFSSLKNQTMCLIRFICGILVIVLSFWLTLKFPLLGLFSKHVPIIAVIIAEIGGCIGTFLILSGAHIAGTRQGLEADPQWEKYAQTIAKTKTELAVEEERRKWEKKIDSITNKELREKLNIADSQLNHAKFEQERLKEQIQRLENMYSSIETFCPQLKLNLLNVNLKVPDFQNSPLETPQQRLKGILGTTWEEHLGLIMWEYESHFGVDLSKLKFYSDEDKIYVTGLEPENFASLVNPKPEILISQRRKINGDKKGKPKTVELLDDDDKALSGQQITTFLQMKKPGVDIEGLLKESIEKSAQKFIRLMLSAFDKKIEFVETLENFSTKSLPDFYNQTLKEKQLELKDIGFVRQLD